MPQRCRYRPLVTGGGGGGINVLKHIFEVQQDGTDYRKRPAEIQKSKSGGTEASGLVQPAIRFECTERLHERVELNALVGPIDNR